ncbi:MAG: flagellar protein FliS [Rhodothermales bacterium]|jgi:flagellar protein FliS
MAARNRFNSYQTQAVMSASPEQLVIKLYDLGIASCHREDRHKLRAVVKELMGSLDLEDGGEIAGRLYSLYVFCMDQSSSGDLEVISDLLGGLREAFRGVAEKATRAA